MLLPQPLRPTMATNCPAGDVEVDAAQHLLVAERFVEAADGDGQAAVPVAGVGAARIMRIGSGVDTAEQRGRSSCHPSSCLEGRVPGQAQALEQARGAVGELAEQRVDQDASTTTSTSRNSRACIAM